MSRRVAVAGNPNVGKTSLFNALTGARHHVGNYPGVTVERRSGALARGQGEAVELVDLPGIYSLTPYSEDEAVAFRHLSGLDDAPPDAVLVVVDATNLARNLYLVLQLQELGLPLGIALNMSDLAVEAGIEIDLEVLSETLGVPVVATVARTGKGADEVAAMLRALPAQASPALDHVPREAITSAKLEALRLSPARVRWLVAAAASEALPEANASPDEVEALGELEVHELTCTLVEARYRRVDELLATAVNVREADGGEAPSMRGSVRVDAVLTHPIAGPFVFIAVMALVFQSIFTWAGPVMDLIDALMGSLVAGAESSLPEGALRDLLTEGVISGVGNVVIFVPQIALLFLFLGLLEDTGYLARAAFLIDRLMSRVGLHGRAFVPLLSGYACAIPAIMGSRTIRSRRDRLVTILMIPFMSCSARLPIYALVIGAFFEADAPLWGPFNVGGALLLAMYLLSTLSALAIGALYKRTILKSPTPPLVLELPPYRLPRVGNTLRVVGQKCGAFLKDAGTIILASTIVLWGLLSYPEVDPEQLPEGETPIEHSIGGRAAKAVEPALEPIGQDWRIGVGLIGSFAAREVLVSTLGLVYGIEGADDDDAPLRQTLAEARDPKTGEPRYTKLSGLALMIFFLYACQCMSTLAVVKRETQSWGWTAFMFVSMTLIAYVAALLTYQLGGVFFS